MSHEAPQIQLSAYEDLAAIADRLVRYAGQTSANNITRRILDTIDLLGPNPYLGPLHHDPVLARRRASNSAARILRLQRLSAANRGIAGAS